MKSSRLGWSSQHWGGRGRQISEASLVYTVSYRTTRAMFVWFLRQFPCILLTVLEFTLQRNPILNPPPTKKKKKISVPDQAELRKTLSQNSKVFHCLQLPLPRWASLSKRDILCSPFERHPGKCLWKQSAMAIVRHSLKSKALGQSWTSLDSYFCLQALPQVCLLCIFVLGSVGWAPVVSPFLPNIGPFLKNKCVDPLLSQAYQSKQVCREAKNQW